MDIQKNQRYTVTIESLTNEGMGICRINNFVIFVAQAAAGDVCEIQIVKTLKHHGYGIITKLLSPSQERIDPDCDCYRQCGGCCFRHISYHAELKEKEQHVKDCFERLGEIHAECEPILPGNSVEQYRNKAQFPVGRNQNGQMIYGFYANRSHRLIPVQNCKLQPTIFSDIAQETCRLCDTLGIEPYSEQTRQGLLRHIYLRYGEISGEIMLCLVSYKNSNAYTQLAKTLIDRFPQLKSVILNINPRHDNVILGNENQLLAGDSTIKDQLCGLNFELSPHSFYQVNRTQAERLYRIAAEYAQLTGTETVADLYCGVGTIGLSMAQFARSITGVEIVPSAVENARQNALQNKINNATFLCSDTKNAVQTFTEQGFRPDVVLLDPPRKGCDPSVIEDVVKMEPDRVVMISCNPSTAARDCKLFEQMGYKVIKYRPVDMFPRTKHVETVVLLSKGEIDSKKVRVEFSLEDMDMSGFQKGATYEQIKAYVLEKFELKVSSLYISQIKRKCGLDVGQNYNLSKKENAKVPKCPPEKEAAIMDALKYFQMIM